MTFRRAFVVSQVHGRWGKAIQVPGTRALNAGEHATVRSVSCASAGNCSVAGSYTDGFDNQQVFVVSQVHGRWGKAIEVPGTGALNTGGYDAFFSLSCASPGNCGAGGYYRDGQKFSPIFEAFVVSQVNGRWRKAVTVAAAFNRFGALTSSVSCASAGNCVAGGSYDYSGPVAFVVSEVHGHWGTAVRVPGIAAIDKGRGSEVAVVSCASAGNCVAGGQFDGSGPNPTRAFVISMVHGRWGKAIELPGIAAIDGGFSVITSISRPCPSAGNCVVGGIYGAFPDRHVFVDSQVNGRWGTPIEVPGTAELDTGPSLKVNSVSCGLPGNCTVAGIYNVGTTNNQRAFVDSES
jgi:hypothetical protein